MVFDDNIIELMAADTSTSQQHYQQNSNVNVNSNHESSWSSRSLECFLNKHEADTHTIMSYMFSCYFPGLYVNMNVKFAPTFVISNIRGLSRTLDVYEWTVVQCHTGGKFVTCSELTNSREGQLLC